MILYIHVMYWITALAPGWIHFFLLCLISIALCGSLQVKFGCDDDSYVYKGKMDYYTYYEIENWTHDSTGIWRKQRFEANLATSWSAFYHETNVNYPLLNKILARPQWRQRYLAHLRTLLDEDFDTTSAYQVIDEYKISSIQWCTTIRRKFIHILISQMVCRK